MADVVLEDLLDHVRLEAPQCPKDLMQAEFIATARDFCQQTRAWIFEVTDESILQLVSDYDIEVTDPTKAMPIAVEHLEVDGVPSEFREVSWLDKMIVNWRNRSCDDFRYFTQITPRVITFPCVPTKNGTVGGLKYRVSLKPPADATVLDSSLTDDWIEVLQDGTKAGLLAMSGKPWTDQKRADQLAKQYRYARTQARIRASRSYGNPEQRALGARFA